MTASLLSRLRESGADTSLDETTGAPEPTAARVLALLREAAQELDDLRRLGLADEAGALRSDEVLDAVLADLGPPLGVPFLGAIDRRRLRDLARDVGARTTKAGTLRLAAALLGELGTAADVDLLETAGVHPALTLHGATALARLRSDDGRAALLRLMSRTTGASRVIVMDRLLPFARLPVVRLALVRDGFRGLDDEHGREIAPAVAELLGLTSWLEDDRIADDVRAEVRRILELAGHHDLPPQ